MRVEQAIQLPGSLSFRADPELEKILRLAAHVGDVSKDDVHVSYTSLLIALLWSDDPTSRWLQSRAEQEDVRVDEILRHRGMKIEQREAVLKNAESGESPDSRRDFYTVSASTVLQEAGSIAHEAGLTEGGDLGVRHVAASYFFRNPPGHDHQLHQEWGFEVESWRRAFAQFILAAYPSEASAWSSVLSGYIETAEQPDAATLPGKILAGYDFDSDTTRLLRALETYVSDVTPSILRSEQLLEALAGSPTLPDCKVLAEEVGGRLESDRTVPIEPDAPTFDDTGSSYPITHRFKSVLDRSRTLTRSITRTDRIGIRHIIASILVAPDSTAHRKLVDSGVSIPLLRHKLLREFTRRWVNDDGGQWRFHLVGTTPPTIAGYNSDEAASGDDKLDVTRYATAFATVMAASSINPPLSIGIFGDWGSGKSFFMRLMREQTKKVCGIGETDDKGRRYFCRRVVPIKFNAWHYADTNLLASLVQTIFIGLRKALAGDEGESEFLDQVIDNLELVKEVRKAALQRKEEAERTLQLRETELQTASTEAATKATDLKEVATRDVVAIVREQCLSKIEVDEALTVAETYLGVDGVQKLKEDQEKNAGEFMDLVADARVLAGRTRSAWRWLASAPVSKHELVWLITVTVGVLALGGAFAVALRDVIGGAWPAISTVVVEVGAATAMLVRWAKRHLAKIASGLDQFDLVRAKIDAKLAEERSKYAKDVRDAQAARDEAAAQFDEAQAEMNAADEELRQAEKELRESGSAHRIARLIERRLEGRDYAKHLGIMSTIREDFETLSKMMKRMRDDRVPSVEGIEPIDRIVLYVDDLDRCPAETVVAVLEAIHLLLAFELFVVVVGVDIRWLARSLQKKYPQHLAAGTYETDSSNNNTQGASALDYIEKIFQIPFWLPPMDDEASRNMIGELVPPVRQVNEKREESMESREDTARQGHRGGGTPEGTAASATSSDGSVGKVDQAETLVVEAEERSFMLRLAGAVGKSPRRLKRFVNTYRILKASIDALEREVFVIDDGHKGEYRAAMTLLALVAGAPRSALEILQQLSRQKDDDQLGTFEEYVRALDDPGEAQYTEAAFNAYRVASGTEPPSLRDLRHWGPKVARFSFRSGRT